MNWKFMVVLFILGSSLAALAAMGQPVPGYMDAEYYYAGALRLVNGEGFSEPFLWNYLDDPVGIPHPSHLYWMPLASIIAAGGMKLFGSTSFWAARTPFIMLSGFLPIISTCLGLKVVKNSRYAWVAGLVAIFSGVYLVYASIPETFVLYLVLGGMMWLVVFNNDWDTAAIKDLVIRAGLLGILAGLMHLSRADGVLWAAGGILWLLWTSLHHKDKGSNKLRVAMISALMYLAAYFLVMGAWYARNLELFGTLMAAGNSRALWITNYDQTFYFPADQLSIEKWLAAGIQHHLMARWDAFMMNLKNLVAVQGLVILVPLMVAGLLKHRNWRSVQYFFLMGLGTLGLMTLVFPYAGARGGFLHSASAFQTLLWAVVPAGLELFVGWGQRKRNWRPERATPIFGVLLVVVCALLTGWFYMQKVIGVDDAGFQWASGDQIYQEIDKELGSFGIDPQDLLMVNNPPGFYLTTGRASIVIPGGGVEQAVAAADRYGARWLLLETGQGNLTYLYEDPTAVSGLSYRGDIGSMRLFCFDCE